MLKRPLMRISGSVVLTFTVAASLHAGEYEAFTEIRIGQSGVYENTVSEVGSSTMLSQVTDHGSTYGLQPGNGTEISLWSGRASSQSGPGYLRTFAQMNALLGGNEGTFSVYGQRRVQGTQGSVDYTANFGEGFTAESRSYLRDNLTINADGREGQDGMLQLSVAVSGQVYYSHAATDVPQFVDLLQAITADTSVIAVTDATGWMSEDFGVQSYFSFFEPEPLLVNQPASGTATFEIPFVFGEAFDLELQLFSIASVGVYEVPGGMFSMLADFHNTAVISGISVFDNLENPITAATVFGNGGLDYSQTFTAPAAPGLPPLTAVPEPSTVILLSLGGVGLLHRRAIPRKP